MIPKAFRPRTGKLFAITARSSTNKATLAEKRAPDVLGSASRGDQGRHTSSRKTDSTSWADVTRAEVTGSEVLVYAGNRVLHRVDRSQPNSLILPVIVAAIAKTGQS